MTRIVLWAAFLVTVVYVVLQRGPQEFVVPLGLLALALWMWGCGLYAYAKGYSPVLGAALGIPNILGLAALALLPKRARQPAEAAPLPETYFAFPRPAPKCRPTACAAAEPPSRPAF